MIKNFSKLFVLALSVLFLFPLGVSASTISSWADYHFESKKRLPEGTKLYSIDSPC